MSGSDFFEGFFGTRARYMAFLRYRVEENFLERSASGQSRQSSLRGAIRPSLIITTLSQICETSGRIWVERTIVRSPDRPRIKSRIS